MYITAFTTACCCLISTITYKRAKNKVVLKAKGMTKNYKNCKDVCFDGLRTLVEGYIKHANPQTVTDITPQHKIVKNKKGFLVRNSTFQKRFKVVYDKRKPCKMAPLMAASAALSSTFFICVYCLCVWLP